MNTPERRAQNERIRREGWQAAFDGKTLRHNPYRDMDKYQWDQGFLSYEKLPTDNDDLEFRIDHIDTNNLYEAINDIKQILYKLAERSKGDK